MKNSIFILLIAQLALTVQFSNVKAQEARPHAGFRVSDSVICVGDCVSFTDKSTGEPIGWIWQFRGAIPSSSTVENPPYICYDTAGSYAVTLTIFNDSGSATAVKYNYITVKLCNGTNNIEKPDEPLAYPNPFSDNLIVQLNNGYQNGTIILYDEQGHEVYRKQLSAGDKWVINTEHYTAGFYFIRLVNTDGNSIAKQLVKMN